MGLFGRHLLSRFYWHPARSTFATLMPIASKQASCRSENTFGEHFRFEGFERLSMRTSSEWSVENRLNLRLAFFLLAAIPRKYFECFRTYAFTRSGHPVKRHASQSRQSTLSTKPKPSLLSRHLKLFSPLSALPATAGFREGTLA